jgi:ribosome-associated heat shock protein Hsp15
MTERIRIDKWLWHARFYKSRVLAQHAAVSGLIRLNGARVQKASAGVGPGDVLTLPRGPAVVAVRVQALAARRARRRCSTKSSVKVCLIPRPQPLN